MPKKIRVHELAKELGLTNKEAVDLCIALGIDVKTHSSSIEDAQADRARRRAERDGLIREVQPVEEKPVKKSAAKKSATPAEPPAVEPAQAPPATAPVAVEPAALEPVPAPPEVPEPAAAEPAVVEPEAAEPAVVEPVAVEPTPVAVVEPAAPVEPVAVEPAAPVEPVAVEPAAAATTPVEPVAVEPAAAATTPVEPVAVEPAAAATTPVEPAAEQTSAPPQPAEPSEHRIISSTRTVPEPERLPPRPATPAARPPAPPARPAATPPDKGEPARPMAPSGRPIPPPPGRPLSPSGKPIPPPPRPVAPAGRPGGPPGSRPGGPRPGSRPGMPARTGAPAGAGRVPSTAPRGPGAGPGRGPGAGRPSSGRRPPQRRRSGRRRRRSEDLQPQQLGAYQPSSAPIPEGTVVIERGSSAQELGPKLNRTAADIIRFLFGQGEMVTATQALTDDQIELYAIELGADLLLVEPGEEQEMELQALFDDTDDLDESLQQLRPPVITVMGHVDHGKTTLLDRIRSTNVVAGEAGGITQHIGAYQVERDGHRLTFIDTPGHAAFTKMRARGAQVTDVVVLVVAADDGVMPQTVEAINHARAAEVPIVVAVNKIDKENADPQRVLTQLAEHELVPESWGGDTITVELAANEGLGVDDLLEQLLIVAELEELTANPTGRAKGVVLEANLDVGRGPVATVLVDKGELHIGDPIVAGASWGRVRAMIDDQGQQVKVAGPSVPVQVLGLSSVPNAGDEFRVAPDEKTAKTVADARDQRQRLSSQRADARVTRGVRLEDIFDQIQKGEAATLNLILKADVQGSLEALTEALRKLEREDVKPVFVHRGVGGITENDVTLAATTNATIIGFNVRPDRNARDLAEQEDVELRTYEVIYQVLEDIEKAMVGLLAPEFEEVVTGEAEVREIFRVPRVGAVAGCYVLTGVITRGSKVRFLRDGVVIWKGTITSLRRFKEDVREVREGFECGIGLSDFQDLKPGDLIEPFELREIERV